jgi:hypothetical protein
MLQIELPHVNILSKMDLIKQYGNLKFNLDFYTDVLDLSYMIELLEEEEDVVVEEEIGKKSSKTSRNFSIKFKKLNEKICDLIQDYSLVSFLTLNITKKSSIIKCIQNTDKANGYLYGHLDDQELINTYSGAIDIGMEQDEEEESEFNGQQDSCYIVTNDDLIGTNKNFIEK